MGMKEDLRVWLRFLEEFNGISFWREELCLGSELQVQTDAAVSSGYGIFFKDKWYAGMLPAEWHSQAVTRDLTFLELFPIVGALWLWARAHERANSVITFWCNTQAVVQIVNSLLSRSQRVMVLVKALTLRCLHFNIVLQARHVPRVDI